MTRAHCMDCGADIHNCNGFTIGSDWLLWHDGRIPAALVRFLCGYCIGRRDVRRDLLIPPQVELRAVLDVVEEGGPSYHRALQRNLRRMLHVEAESIPGWAPARPM